MSAASHSWRADPGPDPESDDVTCAHGQTLFESDPPPEFVTNCDQPAVHRVELPGVMSTVALCPLHLARWADAYPDHTAVYREYFDLDTHLPDRGWLSGRDVPPRTHGAGKVW